MPPPTRTTAGGPWHYHVYDYPNSWRKGPWELSLGQADRNGYEFYSLVQDLRGLEQYGQQRMVPNIALTSAGIRGTAQGNTIWALSFGNLNNRRNVPNVVFTGGIHAKEWIGAEMAYLLAEYLIMNYHSQPPPGNRYAEKIKELVDTRNIHIIPMLNPDGSLVSVLGGALKIDGFDSKDWRKNRRALPATAADWIDALTSRQIFRAGNPPFEKVTISAGLAQYDVPRYNPDNRIPPPPTVYDTRLLQKAKRTGVDLNRNCSTRAWGYECMGAGIITSANWNPGSRNYFGTGRASEAETQLIEQFLSAHPPAIMIDYHSCGQAILYPTEVYDNGLNADYRAFGAVLQSLIRCSDGSESYKLGSVKQIMTYNASGGLSDHVPQRYPGARALAIELDPPAGPDVKIVNPPEDKIGVVFEKNIRGALATLMVPTAATQFDVVFEFLGWNVYGRGNALPQ